MIFHKIKKSVDHPPGKCGRFTDLFYVGIWQKNTLGKTKSIFGDPGEIRTHDPPLRRRLLYPTELLSHNGRGSRTRTGDPLLPKQVRYQLRYAP